MTDGRATEAGRVWNKHGAGALTCRKAGQIHLGRSGSARTSSTFGERCQMANSVVPAGPDEGIQKALALTSF